LSEQSTTPDLAELVGRTLYPLSTGDVDAVMRMYAPDSVFDLSTLGLDTFTGAVAIRAFVEDWFAAYDEVDVQTEEILDLGNRVAFALVCQTCRPRGSTNSLQVRYAAVSVWVDGLAMRTRNYLDIDEARAAAERLAEEPADG
jgi:ketosteroid isomerase-like protein